MFFFSLSLLRFINNIRCHYNAAYHDRNRTDRKNIISINYYRSMPLDRFVTDHRSVPWPDRHDSEFSTTIFCIARDFATPRMLCVYTPSHSRAIPVIFIGTGIFIWRTWTGIWSSTWSVTWSWSWTWSLTLIGPRTRSGPPTGPGYKYVVPLKLW